MSVLPCQLRSKVMATLVYEFCTHTSSMYGFWLSSKHPDMKPNCTCPIKSAGLTTYCETERWCMMRHGGCDMVCSCLILFEFGSVTCPILQRKLLLASFLKVVQQCWWTGEGQGGPGQRRNLSCKLWRCRNTSSLIYVVTAIRFVEALLGSEVWYNMVFQIWTHILSHRKHKACMHWFLQSFELP